MHGTEYSTAMHGSGTAISATGGSVDRLLYSVQEVAEALGVTDRYVRTLIAAGEIKSVRIGARRMIPVKDLNVWIDGLREAEEAAREAAMGPRASALAAGRS